MESTEIDKIKEPSEQITDLNGLWLVCFTGRDERSHWWDKIWFTRRDFRHCYAIQYQVYMKSWVLIDWQTGICDVVILKDEELANIFAYMQDNFGTAIIVKRKLVERKTQYRIPLIYCVQAVLHIVGLPTKWTFTPYQLYKRLIAEGYEVLFNYRSKSHGECSESYISPGGIG